MEIKNRSASFDYFIEDKFDAGMMLTGTEVKALRAGMASFNDSYCLLDHGDLYIKAMHRALYIAYKKNKFTSIIVDGNYFKPIICPDNDDEIIEYSCIIKGDTKYINIAAASIIAKDYHDNEIIKIVNENPDLNKYNLIKNMGYATLKHRNAIKEYGIHDLHRKTFSSCNIKVQD